MNESTTAVIFNLNSKIWANALETQNEFNMKHEDWETIIENCLSAINKEGKLIKKELKLTKLV